jgi:ElaB/YqjD/DUF883 family membrane-anchored ribosome-binding protein
MDAGSTNVESGPVQTFPEKALSGSTPDLDFLIFQIRKAEAGIVRDIRNIRELLAPKRAGRLLVSAVVDRFSERIKAMKTQSISEASEKAINNTTEFIRNHPTETVLTGLGVGCLIALGMRMQSRTGGKTNTPVDEVGPDARKEPSERTEKLEQASAEATEISRSVRDSISGFMDENPLTTGFIGLSTGVLIGILTSGILRENELINETRRNIKEKTLQILNETKEKAGRVVGVARQAAKEEAERQNLLLH